MANTFLKATKIAQTGLGLLEREILIPGLVWRNAGGDFRGAANDTITLRIPARTSARTRTFRAARSGSPLITMDSLTETGVDVKLDTVIYNAVPVTDEELTLDITSFGAQVLAPQMRAVAEALEDLLVDAMQNANYATVIEAVSHDGYALADGEGLYNAFVDARKALNDANVPQAGRAIVMGSDFEARLLKSDLFRRADQSGSTSARTDAFLGRVAGFDLYVSNALNQDEAYAFHRTAYTLATRAPLVPEGASYGASVSSEGFSLRWLRDYDYLQVQDRSLVDVFAGASAVHDGPEDQEGDPTVVRAVKIVDLETEDGGEGDGD